MFTYLLKSLRPFPLPGAALVLTIVFDAAYDSLMPLGVSALLDRAVIPKNLELLVFYAALLLGGWLASVTSQLLRDYLYSWLSSRVLHHLRLRLEDDIYRMSLGRLKTLRPADILSRFGSDLAVLENLLLNVLPGLLFAVLYLVLGLGVMALADPGLALVVLLGLPLTVLGPLVFGKKAAKTGQIMKKEEADLSAGAQEILGAQALLRTFNLSASFRRAFEEKSESLRRRAFSFYLFTNLTRRSPNLGVQLLHLGILIGGAVLAYNGQLGVGTLLAFSLLFANVHTAVVDLSQAAGPLLQADLAFKRIFTLRPERDGEGEHDSAKVSGGGDESSSGELPAQAAGVGAGRKPRAGPTADSESGRNRPGLPPLKREIRLENVGFSYGNNQILTDVSLSLPALKRSALVGPSGAGKSTLLNILSGLVPPDRGRRLWDDLDLARADRTAYLDRISVVFQDNPIFNTSIRDNIVLGQGEGLSRSELEDRLGFALGAAGLDAWVAELPAGPDTQVGEGGGFLSGGQRQRLALARALFRRPDFLILDEATSALDPFSEQHVNDAVRRLVGACTVLHITHRLEGIKDYERILVLSGGRCAQAGTHEELLAQDEGLYARMWKKQSGLILNAEGTEAKIRPETLRDYPVFASSSEATRAILATAFLSETVESGRLVIRQGSPGSRFFVIARGKVEVSIDSPTGRAVVATLSEGDVFGEMSLLGSQLTSANVTALVPTLLLSLEKSSFLKILRSDPELGTAVRALSERRRAENEERERTG